MIHLWQVLAGCGVVIALAVGVAALAWAAHRIGEMHDRSGEW